MKNRHLNKPDLFLIIIILFLYATKLLSFEETSKSILTDDFYPKLYHEFNNKAQNQVQVQFPGILGMKSSLPGTGQKTLFGDNKTFENSFTFEAGVSPVTSLDYGSAFNLELHYKLGNLGFKFVNLYGSEFFKQLGDGISGIVSAFFRSPFHDYPRQTFVMRSLSLGLCSDMTDFYYSVYAGIGYLKGTFRGAYSFTQNEINSDSNGNYYTPENVAGLCFPLEIECGCHYDERGVSLTFRRIISTYKPIDTFYFNFILFIF